MLVAITYALLALPAVLTLWGPEDVERTDWSRASLGGSALLTMLALALVLYLLDSGGSIDLQGPDGDPLFGAKEGRSIVLPCVLVAAAFAAAAGVALWRRVAMRDADGTRAMEFDGEMEMQETDPGEEGASSTPYCGCVDIA